MRSSLGMTDQTDTAKDDVIVIGGGPAGTATAALLAKKGWKVRVLEKCKMPRYHIGESLMPYCWFTLERLGVLPQIEAEGFTQKLSVNFVSPDGSQSRPFYFFQHHDHPSSYTWQVTRSRFDQILWDNAAAKGAILNDGVKVTRLLRNESTGAVIGVAIEDEHGKPSEFKSTVVIDCSGRDALSAAKEGWRTRDPKLNKISIWTYWKGAKRDSGLDAGSTTVAYLPQKGWFWYIPLQNDVVSVGIVAERDYLFKPGATRDPDEILRREIDNNAWIKEHLGEGEQFGEYWVTGEYSYRSRYCADDGLVLAGDAFAFLDPVFSSGVFLALKSGEMAADNVDQALRDGDVSAAKFDAYGAKLCEHIEIMRRIVYAFYDKEFNFGKLIRAYPDIRGRLTDCLIGDVDQDFDELFRRVAEFADLPQDLDYGNKGCRRKGTLVPA